MPKRAILFIRVAGAADDPGMGNAPSQSWRIVCAGIVFLCLPARADLIQLQNGQTVDGDVTAESGQTVTVEISTPAATLTRQINKSQIRLWDRSAHQGPPYVILPVEGAIGSDVTADALRAGFDEAKKADPRYVVLYIDSPGGDIGEMIQIVNVVADQQRQMEVVAYVKDAYSAAAVIAMTCRRVFLAPNANIGAIVPFTMTENGPQDVDAKWRSAIDATIRASNEHGGHADLLIRGMSELDLEIFLSEADGHAVLTTEGPGKPIKAKGQILCLTADEAVECGLAHVATNLTDLGQQLSGGPWYRATRRPWNAVLAVAIAKQHEMARQTALARIAPTLDQLESRMAELAAKSAADKNTISDLNAQSEAEIKQINTEYQQAVTLAQYQDNPSAATAHAVEVMNSRSAEARQNLQKSLAPLQADAEKADIEIAQLRGREKELLATVPN